MGRSDADPGTVIFSHIQGRKGRGDIGEISNVFGWRFDYG